MNKDQVTSAVRSVLKIVGAGLAAHGLTKAASASLVNAEDFIGVVVTLVGVLWSHFSNTDTAIQKKADAITVKAALVLIFAGLFFTGCSTSQLAIAEKASVATDLTVSTAMNGWGVYVDAKHPGTNAERQVLHTWQAVKAAELTVIDAEASLVSNPTNTSPLTAAQSAYQATAADLFTLLSSITNAVNTK